MKFLAFLPLVVAVSALPGHSSKTQPYRQRKPGDSRSPCPGLNTLANHGYLPHNGQGINGPKIVEAFQTSMNFAREIIDHAIAVVFDPLGLDPNSTSVSVKLEDFFVRNITDIRCSVTRMDYEEQIDPSRIALALTQDEMDHATPDSWGKVRVAIESLTTNPLPYAGDIQHNVGTAGLMFLSTTENSHPAGGDYSKVVSRKDWITAFLEEERFPIELGWKPQAVSPSNADLQGIQNAVQVAREKYIAAHGGV